MLSLFFLLLLQIAGILYVQSSPLPITGSRHLFNQGTRPGTSVTNVTICNNQLPYHWNGLTCLTAGTYTATLVSGDGSDSTAVLNLFVINVSTSITNAIICNDQLPYRWNGNSYTTSGTYSVTLTSSTGCDSVPILSLTVNDVVTSTTNITICSNLLPFNWNGNSYSAAGSYLATLVSAAGCDSVATLNLVVKPLSSSLTSSSICRSQLPFSWNGNSYTAAGSYSITLTAANGCDSIATLQLTLKLITFSNTSITICSNAAPYNWNGRNYSVSGIYSTTLTGSNGCDSVPTLALTVLPVKTSTTVKKICIGQLPYSWNGNTYNASGTYTAALTASNGCDSIATLVLTTAAFLNGTDNAIICNTELPFSWNGNNYNASGVYSVTLLTPAGCDSIVTLSLTVTTPSTGTDSIFLCIEELPLTWHGYVFNAAGDYPISPPVVIDDCHSVDLLVVSIRLVPPSTTVANICANSLPFVWNGQSYTASGIYGVVIPSRSGCDSIANLNLNVITILPTTTIVTVCSNQLPYTWNGNNYLTSGIYRVTLTGSGGCDSVTILNLTVVPVTASTTAITICSARLPYTWNGSTYTAGGNYVVTLTGSGGCDSVATLQLTVQLFLTSNTSISICSNQLPYTWNGNSYMVGGTYTTNLISSNGCDSLATLVLAVNDVITSITNLHICSNQLPFNWNGFNYTSSGAYSTTLVTTSGCDSLAMLNLFVDTALSSTSNFTICNNQLPYAWNGNSYSVAGTYIVPLISSNGCDSMATLNLMVTDILTSNTNVTICPALLPYQWNGNSYLTGGTYSVTLSTSAGCDSVPILSLTVAPYVESFTDITICNSDTPFSWNGNNYSTSGVYPVLITGSSACDSLATLNLTVRPPISSVSLVELCETALPYNWNGVDYSSAGMYTLTLASANGCDSVATLNLVSNPSTSSTTNTIICSSQLPYLWNGTTYPTGGTYVRTLVNSKGCDSVATLQLDVQPVVSSNDTITICPSAIPYSWNGNLYVTPGNYNVALISSGGCDSIANLTLLVSSTLSSSTPATVCETQLPYSWNGMNYTIAGDYAVTLVSGSGCDSIAILHLSVIPTATSITQASVCETQLPFAWNGQQINTAGTYLTTLASAAGCDSIATLNLLILPVTGSQTLVNTCTNQLPFIWNAQPYSAPGNYTALLTNSQGCDSLATLHLNVHPVTTSVTAVNICSAQLPFIWNGQNLSTPGLYTMTLTGGSGCDSIVTLDLTIQQTPAAPLVNSPVTYCQFQATSPLTATAAGNGLLNWYAAATGGTPLSAAPTPSAAVAGTTIYYVSEIDGNCEGPRKPVTVTVNRKPDLGTDQVTRICFEDSADIGMLYDTSGYDAQWTYGSSNVPDINAVTAPGDYQLMVENSFGCMDTAIVTLFVQPEVIANAGPDADVETNIPYQLTGSGGGNYLWAPASFLNNPGAQNPVATIPHDQVFVLVVKDEIGCSDVDTVKLRAFNGPTFYIPSAFTPNGDGLNDEYFPTPVGIRSLEYFRVFNRFGELVFETSDIGKGWDGTFRGKPQQIGNYVWSLKGTDRLGQLKMMKGNVVLIR